jgi:hypothetical protein
VGLPLQATQQASLKEGNQLRHHQQDKYSVHGVIGCISTIVSFFLFNKDVGYAYYTMR